VPVARAGSVALRPLPQIFTTSKSRGANWVHGFGILGHHCIGPNAQSFTEGTAVLATQYATSALTISRLATVALGLCFSACAEILPAASATAEQQDPAAARASVKTADPEQLVGVFTGTYENGVPLYRLYPPTTVTATRKVELPKIAREEKLAREPQIGAQVAAKHPEQEYVKSTPVLHVHRNGFGADGAS
jgi:hypothetical protein